MEWHPSTAGRTASIHWGPQVSAGFKRTHNAFTSPHILRPCLFTPMDSRYHHQSYYPCYEGSSFTGPHVNNPLERHPTRSMYQGTPPDQTSMPTQHATEWDIRYGLRRTPDTFPTIPSTNPAPPRVSGGGYLLISAQPVGVCPAQLQVSPAVVSNRALT